MPGDKATVIGIRERFGEVVRIIHSGGLSLNEGDVAATSVDGEMYFFRADQLAKLD